VDLKEVSEVVWELRELSWMEELPLNPSHMFSMPNVGEADDNESKLQWVVEKYRG
jgi:hypothetical protein